jgi:peptidyl-prolyl cis-trans isomerase A (cyclophilin A)
MRLLFVVALLVMAAGCMGQSPPAQTPQTTLQANMKETVVLETSKGNIELELDRQKAPASVENFIGYVKSGHYDGTIFHRVIPDFMIQGGGFTSDGKQKATRAPIKLESNNGLKNVKGAIAMARTNAPDSATSQFFINVQDNPSLDYSRGMPGYAVFGRVVSGMDVVETIRYVKTSSRGQFEDWPQQDVLIMKAYLK